MDKHLVFYIIYDIIGFINIVIWSSILFFKWKEDREKKKLEKSLYHFSFTKHQTDELLEAISWKMHFDFMQYNNFLESADKIDSFNRLFKIYLKIIEWRGNNMYTFTFTQEEVDELTRTLLGRLDLDLEMKAKEAMKQGKREEVVHLSHLIEVNKSIFRKVSDKSKIF